MKTYTDQYGCKNKFYNGKEDYVYEIEVDCSRDWVVTFGYIILPHWHEFTTMKHPILKWILDMHNCYMPCRIEALHVGMDYYLRHHIPIHTEGRKNGCYCIIFPPRILKITTTEFANNFYKIVDVCKRYEKY